ncbi:MAG: oligosaccharide flippase family protein [Acidobacteriota bacterium]|nr:oligosaccharide flippase family protein [Acidobacteriota bacterium]
MPAPNDVTAYLRRGGLALVATGFGGFAADYLFNVGLARLLDAHAYGDFRVAAAFAAFFGMAVLLGGDRAAPKTLAGPMERGEHAQAWEYLRFYFELSLILSLVIIAATWTAAVLHLGHTDPADHHALAWVVLSVPINAAGALVSRALQSARRPVLASLPWRIAVPLLSLLFVVLFARLQGGIEVHHAVVLSILAVIVVTGGQWWLLRRLELRKLGRDPSFRAPRQWLTTSMPMMGAFLIVLALNQSDLYLLEVLGDEEEVGLYAAAATSAHFLLIIQTAVVSLVASLVQPAREEGPEALQRTFRQGQRLLLTALLPAAALLVLAGGPILDLFGAGFDRAEPELILLAVGNLVWAAAALSTLRLQYTERGQVVVAIALVTLVADSLLNVLLIPTYGMRGAAASTAVTTSLAAAAILVAHGRKAADPNP